MCYSFWYWFTVSTLQPGWIGKLSELDTSACKLVALAFVSVDDMRYDITMFTRRNTLSDVIFPLLFEGHLGELLWVSLSAATLITVRLHISSRYFCSGAWVSKGRKGTQMFVTISRKAYSWTTYSYSSHQSLHFSSSCFWFVCWRAWIWMYVGGIFSSSGITVIFFAGFQLT